MFDQSIRKDQLFETCFFGGTISAEMKASPNRQARAAHTAAGRKPTPQGHVAAAFWDVHVLKPSGAPNFAKAASALLAGTLFRSASPCAGFEPFAVRRKSVLRCTTRRKTHAVIAEVRARHMPMSSQMAAASRFQHGENHGLDE